MSPEELLKLRELVNTTAPDFRSKTVSDLLDHIDLQNTKLEWYRQECERPLSPGQLFTRLKEYRIQSKEHQDELKPEKRMPNEKPPFDLGDDRLYDGVFNDDRPYPQETK